MNAGISVRYMLKVGVAGFLILCQIHSTEIHAQNRILYFGDSITEGWMDAEKHEDLAYPSKMDSVLTRFGYDIISVNAGKGGETTVDALARIDSELSNFDPDIVIISFGSNDLYILDANAGSRVNEQQFERNLNLLVQKCLGLRIAPILLGLPPVLGERFYDYNSEVPYIALGGVEAMNRRYDSIIATTANNLKVQYVSLDFGAPDKIGHLLGFDGVHPTAEGHAKIAERLFLRIVTLIVNGQPEPEHPITVDIYPQPFQFALHGYLAILLATSVPRSYEVHIFNNTGQRVISIPYDAGIAGTHYILWNGFNEQGTKVAPGAYFIQIKYPEGTISKQLIVK
jgi:lysophospholipase L1-like esterase